MTQQYWHTLQVLVLPLQGLQLIQSLFIGVLHLEELSAERASLFLSTFQLSLALLILLLPFCQNLIRTKYVVLLTNTMLIQAMFLLFQKGITRTLSKFLCFLSRLAASAFALSTSIMRSSTSPWSLCLVFSKEAHLEFIASMDSSASWRRCASFFL